MDASGISRHGDRAAGHDMRGTQSGCSPSCELSASPAQTHQQPRAPAASQHGAAGRLRRPARGGRGVGGGMHLSFGRAVSQGRNSSLCISRLRSKFLTLRLSQKSFSRVLQNQSLSQAQAQAACLSTALLASPCSAEDFLPPPACFAGANPLNLANLSPPSTMWSRQRAAVGCTSEIPSR